MRDRIELRSDRKDCAPKTTSIALLTTCVLYHIQFKGMPFQLFLAKKQKKSFAGRLLIINLMGGSTKPKDLLSNDVFCMLTLSFSGYA